MKKYRILICVAMLVPVLCLQAQVSAEGGDGFRLDSSGQVTLDSSHAAKEGISSLCFSLTVEPEDADRVEFVFSGSSAEILEYSYRADEKKLNIYMAGTTPLFATGTDSLSVGRVVVKGGDGKDGEATVGVEPDSLQFVYGSKLMKIEGVDIPEAVRIGSAGEPSQTQTPPPATSSPTAPPGTSAPANPPQTPVPVETPGLPGNGGQDAGSSGAGWGEGGQSQNGQGGPQKVVVGGQAAGGNSAKPADRRQEDKKESEPSEEDSYVVAPVPLYPDEEDPASFPEEGLIEVVTLPDFGGAGQDGEQDLPGQDSDFLEDVKLFGTGFAIAAGVAATCACVIALALRAPRKRFGKKFKRKRRQGRNCRNRHEIGGEPW